MIDRDKLWEIAKDQTITNEDGRTVICRDDVSFDDDMWDELYVEGKMILGLFTLFFTSV